MPYLEIKKKYEELNQLLLPDQSDNDALDKLVDIILHGPLLKFFAVYSSTDQERYNTLKKLEVDIRSLALCAEERRGLLVSIYDVLKEFIKQLEVIKTVYSENFSPNQQGLSEAADKAYCRLKKGLIQNINVKCLFYQVAKHMVYL